MTGRSDDLAARFSSRLKATPAKGRVADAGTPAERSSVTGRSADPERPARPRRGATGTVLRGHLVPAELHAALSRRKVELQIERGMRMTWSDVVAEAIEAATVDSVALIVDSGAGWDAPTRQMLQATLTEEMERRFLTLHLELSARSLSRPVLEQVWGAVLSAWLGRSAWPTAIGVSTRHFAKP